MMHEHVGYKLFSSIVINVGFIVQVGLELMVAAMTNDAIGESIDKKDVDGTAAKMMIKCRGG